MCANVSTWDPDAWDRCCTRCGVSVSWDGDLPELEEEAICYDCALTELDQLRARFRKLEPAARAVLECMLGTCDHGEPKCQNPSFAGFMHGMCNVHAEEFDAPVAALKDQSLVTNLKEALDAA